MSQSSLFPWKYDTVRRVRTRIGWTVTGRVPGYIQEQESVCKVHVATPDEELNETVKTWWRTENFGCRYDDDTQRLVEDARVMNFLNESTRKVDGRYEVPLICAMTVLIFLTTLPLQLGDLNFLRRDLVVILSWLQITRKVLTWTWRRDTSKGLLKRKQLLQSRENGTFLITQLSTLRNLVCDAAAKVQGSSLNSHLLTGPDLLNNFVGIFMRFRKKRLHCQETLKQC